jgi:serine acetyltransferase
VNDTKELMSLNTSVPEVFLRLDSNNPDKETLFKRHKNNGNAPGGFRARTVWEIADTAFIDPTAIVLYNCAIGHNTTIGTASVLNNDATLESNVHIGERVNIGKNARICDNVIVGNDVSIGAYAIVRPNTRLKAGTVIKDWEEVFPSEEKTTNTGNTLNEH